MRALLCVRCDWFCMRDAPGGLMLGLEWSLSESLQQPKQSLFGLVYFPWSHGAAATVHHEVLLLYLERKMVQ